MKPERDKSFSPAEGTQHIDHGNNATHQAGQDKRHNNQCPFCRSLGMFPIIVGRCGEAILPLFCLFFDYPQYKPNLQTWLSDFYLDSFA